MENGKPDEAIAQFTEALRLKPDFVQARQQLEKISANANLPANRSTP